MGEKALEVEVEKATSSNKFDLSLSLIGDIKSEVPNQKMTYYESAVSDLAYLMMNYHGYTIHIEGDELEERFDRSIRSLRSYADIHNKLVNTQRKMRDAREIIRSNP